MKNINVNAIPAPHHHILMATLGGLLMDMRCRLHYFVTVLASRHCISEIVQDLFIFYLEVHDNNNSLWARGISTSIY